MTADLSRLSIKDKTPQKRSPLLPLIIGGVLLAGTGYYLGQGGSGKEETSRSEAASPQQISPSSPPPAPAAPASPLFNATGYVVAQRSAAVSSKATGRLKELLVIEGDKVQQGQTIGILENDDLQAALNEKEALLTQLAANERALQAELENARTQRDRFKRLLESSSISREEFDTAETRVKKAIAELDAIRAQRTVTKAQIERAKVELQYTHIQAPFDGTVLTKSAEVGEIVAPFGSSANARAALVTIADMNSLQIEADVSESNLAKVYVGQPCAIRLDSVPGKVYKGEVVKIVPTVDKAKATVLTKIAFLEKGPEVIPQMSAKIECEVRGERVEQRDASASASSQ